MLGKDRQPSCFDGSEADGDGTDYDYRAKEWINMHIFSRCLHPIARHVVRILNRKVLPYMKKLQHIFS